MQERQRKHRLIRAVLCALLVLAAMGFQARAESCDDDTIDKVSDDGEIITMLSGAAFRVRLGDQVDAALWMSTEDVLICKDETEIINKDENNERASVHRIR